MAFRVSFSNLAGYVPHSKGKSIALFITVLSNPQLSELQYRYNNGERGLQSGLLLFSCIQTQLSLSLSLPVGFGGVKSDLFEV